MKTLTIEFTPQGFNVMIGHVRQGRMCDVAELVADIERQAQAQVNAAQTPGASVAPAVPAEPIVLPEPKRARGRPVKAEPETA